ncbi:MAG: DUF58 domain-containing protein [Nanoarchaeota archaeon]|nr:DUF58 domain-containing protein [Nanoarchaeota archaeon]
MTMEKKLNVDFAKTTAQFENAIKKFQVKQLIYRTLFRGKGLEFDSYRRFSNGEDDANYIDWKATLRANELMMRKYIEERDLNFYFIVNVSNGMLFGSNNKLKAEYAAEIIIALSHLIITSGDSIGLIMFNDHFVKVLKPSKSKNQFFLFTKFLADPNLYGGKIDFRKVVDQILKEISSPYSILLLVSDFIHLNKGFERELKLLGAKYETIAVMIRDPLDENLPNTKNQIVVNDPYSGEQLIVDPAIASELYRQNSLRQKNIVKELFKKSKIDLVELNSSSNFVVPLVSFLKSRVGRKE